MRRVRYQVAMSLDGYIAGPNGEYDWIVEEKEIDFSGLFAQFDTFVMGRGTFEVMKGSGGTGMFKGSKVIVFSRTLKPEDAPGVTIAAGDPTEIVAALKAEEGKDIWLFGGGVLFREFLERGLVDTVEVAVIPVLVGGGIQLLPPPAKQTSLRLTGSRVYQTSGIVMLEYDVAPPPAKKKAKRKA
jgi:dihydrofolate reductase